MSKWPMRGHFRYLRFKTFPMTPKTPQCKVFWALLLNSKHSGVSEDSKSLTLGVLGFTPTLGQSGVATDGWKYQKALVQIIVAILRNLENKLPAGNIRKLLMELMLRKFCFQNIMCFKL